MRDKPIYCNDTYSLLSLDPVTFADRVLHARSRHGTRCPSWPRGYGSNRAEPIEVGTLDDSAYRRVTLTVTANRVGV